MFTKLIESLRRGRRRAAEQEPVRLLEDQHEGKYIAFRIPASQVDGLIEYAKTYSQVEARVDLLACEGERYAYLKQDGTTSAIQRVGKGDALVGIYGLIDEKGTLSPHFASSDNQFLNNGMRFASDYTHRKDKDSRA